MSGIMKTDRLHSVVHSRAFEHLPSQPNSQGGLPVGRLAQSDARLSERDGLLHVEGSLPASWSRLE